MKLRTGRKIDVNLYLQAGEDPLDGDPVIAQAQSPVIADLIARGVNYAIEHATSFDKRTEVSTTVAALWADVADELSRTAPERPVATHYLPKEEVVKLSAAEQIAITRARDEIMFANLRRAKEIAGE